ncbi:MAG: DUF1553 domain-containing protein [Gemmataceae bacterium]|nr:DUF1553 domain-containing protein [Gemmataceae bacterium]
MTSVLRVFGLVSFVALALSSRGAIAQDAAGVEFFEKKIRPILVGNCYTCHSANTNSAGGLRVDDRNGLLAGGNTGKAIVPGSPETSLLIQRVTLKNIKKRMPLEGKELTEEQVADLTTWIKNGAAWPAIRVPASIGKTRADYEKLKKEHWAWQPITQPKTPAVNDAAWARDDIDRFLLAKLDANNLRPVADADATRLLRRVTFDLTGLPPTPEQIATFIKDPALEKLVDRLLASQQFGERWGRHWLDVARYGESTGPSRNIPYPHAWKYRDYVIDAVNADVPFDRFIQEQIAGDRLPSTTKEQRDRQLTATGFLALGVKDVNQRYKVRFVMDNVDEQIDAVTRSFMGLTVSCARCHDHKFDPIPTTDYYALAGIFASTDNCAGVRNKMGGGGLDYFDPSMLVRLSADPPPPPAAQVVKLTAELAEAKKAWDAIRGTPEGLKPAADGQPTQRPIRLKFEKLQADLLAISDPSARGYVIHGVRDAKSIGDTEVRIRGEAEKLGPKVPRGFLTTFEVPGASKISADHSGRLELAKWLSSEKNPLTSRVIVNRVWQHLFGTGIVSSVDNFGVNGDVPSNPELLDHLANRFVQDGWSIKKLVRTLVLTRAYQLGSESTEAHRTKDPGNQLVWRHSPRRLTAEEIRDATLLAAGTLDISRPAGSPAQKLRMVEMPDNGPEARSVNDQADQTKHRSVYLPLLRGVVPHSLEAFDPVDQTLVTGSRDTTTVPGQALFLLNSTFVRRHSLILAEKLLADNTGSDAARIQAAYRRTVGREPSEPEIERVLAFLGEYESTYRDQRPVVPAKPVPKKKVEPKKAVEPPFDPDQVDQTGVPVTLTSIQPKDARTASWLAFVQALYGSAEFRYVR